MVFESVLFFPVTPFDAADRVDEELLAAHVAGGVAAGAGGVFAACGTGELHALSVAEAQRVVAVSVEAAAGRVPVVAGAGGSLGTARELARGAADAGADAVLLMPPYLVQGSQTGLLRYVDAVAQASPLPLIVYHRANAQFTPDSARALAADPRVIGIKDGAGDIGRAQELVVAVRSSGRDDFLFFNGLLTAEVSQAAYRGIGMPLYSSAAFAMAPEVALAYYRAYIAGDEPARLRLLDRFFLPLVALRDETPGFAVSLIKAGLRLKGVPVGSVRPPLTDPDERQTARLAEILEAGEAVVRELTR
nr:5-dehydro-4-deoxyglucarate dehydratase [Gryllotalpicola ginsengisoli]